MKTVNCAAWTLAFLIAPAFGLAKSDSPPLPLETTRRAEFNVNEATWLSLDVSPDGRTIVIEILGDIYVLPIEGGEAHPIAAGLSYDSQPAFSPDGRGIAFISDRSGSENVWIMKPDGSEPLQLSRETDDVVFASPAWSHDGLYVIASRMTMGGSTFEIWMYHTQGGKGIQVTKAQPKPDTPRGQRHNALGAVMSPDGKALYFARKSGGFQYNAPFPMWEVVRRDMTTGTEDVVASSPGSSFRPKLSPDGRFMAYGTRYDTQTGLRLRNLQTGEDRWLVFPVQRDDQESRFTRDLLPGYAFMPDGGTILFTEGGKIRTLQLDSGRTGTIPFSATVAMDLGPLLNFPYALEEGPVRARLIQGAVQSPAGDKLAFSALGHLYVVDLPSGTPRRLTSAAEPEFQPAWSADGQWIAYVTWSAGEGHLWKVTAEGNGSPQRLSPYSAFYAEPAWAPDGSRIVLMRGSAHLRMTSETVPLDLIWISSEGGDPNLIAPARGLGKPHFGPEKDRLYACSTDVFPNDEGSGLVSMRLDGTDRRFHLKLTGKGIYFAEKPVGARDLRISPDGKWVLGHLQNQLYLVALPQVGGEPPAVDINSPSVPIARITDVGADSFAWNANGTSVTWSIGSTFFRRPASSIPFPRPDADSESASSQKRQSEEEGKVESLREVDPAVESFEVKVEAPRRTAKGSLLLSGATLITMKGDEVLANADLLIRDNRIAAVGPSGKLEVPPDVQKVDLRGKFVVPGLIDTHAHWFGIRRDVLDFQNWSFLANLAYGVTTGLDVQTSTNDMFAYQDLADAGLILGPRALSTGPGIFSDNSFKSVEQVKAVMMRYRDHYRTRNLKSYIVGNRKQRQLVAMAARELEMIPTTEGGLDLKLDLTHAIDGFGGNEHSLPVVPIFDDVVQLISSSGIGYTPTLLVNYGGPFGENFFFTTTEVHDDPKLNRFVPHDVIDEKTRRLKWFRQDEYVFPRTAEQAAKIVRAGGRVGVGSHGQLQGLGYHWEMWALASGGLTPFEVLRAATLHGAEIIGVARDVGSIEEGKLADLVVLEKNPLKDIRNSTSIRFVVKDGILYEGETLEELWPEQKELEPPWWWGEKPPVTDLSRAD